MPVINHEEFLIRPIQQRYCFVDIYNFPEFKPRVKLSGKYRSPGQKAVSRIFRLTSGVTLPVSESEVRPFSFN